MLGFYPTIKSKNPAKKVSIREREVTNESGGVPKQLASCVLRGEGSSLVPKMAGQICHMKAAHGGLTACH